MAHAIAEQRRLILDQFTRQAVPFSQMRDHSPGLIRQSPYSDRLIAGRHLNGYPYRHE